jgi:PhzF family phenazine biosynthesis protein
MMKIQLYQVDAFTDTLFGGNPAAVCPLQDWPESNIMQHIAAENNLAETAFFVDKGSHYELRWFTPEVEVDLCGHATLASGYVLFHHLNYQGNEIRFQSKSGILKVTRKDDLITLDFPASHCIPVGNMETLADALGYHPLEVYKARDYLALFSNEKTILQIQPDFEKLKTLDCLGIIVTAPGNRSDFVSRFFAPAVGINEDPVTGSAHTMLIPFWAEKLKKNKLHAYQLSKRGGELFCELAGDRVLISGKAVTYLAGKISV